MNPNSPANLKFKDSFFTKLFSEPKALLGLYNALSGSNYAPDTPVEITTLEKVFYNGRYNDLSFILDGKLVVLIEHQSTINPNMPLRCLMYLASLYENYVRSHNNKSIYSSQLLRLPRPEFFVLYNGSGEFPNDSTMKLSDAFFDVPTGSSLELEVRVLNINKGHNSAIVQESAELYGYSDIVAEIHRNRDSGMSSKEAINKAVNDGIKRNILREFLTKYGREVMHMLYAEWDWDEYVAVQREESEAIGEARGEARGEAIGEARGEAKERLKLAREMLLDNVPIDKIMRYTGLTEAELNTLGN